MSKVCKLSRSFVIEIIHYSIHIEVLQRPNKKPNIHQQITYSIYAGTDANWLKTEVNTETDVIALRFPTAQEKL